jgi:hypothetical protein
MKSFVFALFCFLVFLIAVSAPFAVRFIQLKLKEQKPYTATHVTIETQPSRSAVRGAVASASGEVSKYPRSSIASVSAAIGDPLLQGEEIENGETGESVMTFPDMVTLIAGNKADVSFVSTVPQAIIFNQFNGEVVYSVNTGNRIAVKVLHSLIEITGDVKVAVKDKLIQISVVDGIAKIGYLDKNNDTQVREYGGETNFVFNDGTRTVKVLK